MKSEVHAALIRDTEVATRPVPGIEGSGSISNPREESIIETIQKRMDDPNYIPTGPTYGEFMAGRVGGPAINRDEVEQQVIAVVMANPHFSAIDLVMAERERCAKIAEHHARPIDANFNSACYEIAAAIRSGK